MKFARWIPVTITLSLLLVTRSSFGQRVESREYRPARPTLSPYVGLLQSNFGGLPNYFSLVRPMREQESFNRRLQTTTRFQALRIQRVGSETPGAVTNQTGRNPGFGQLLHYYPPTPVRERAR